MDRAQRNALIEKQLSGLMGLRGVTAAGLIDSDGFVTHMRRDFEIDTDAIGAAVQIVLGSARRAASNVDQGETDVVLIENKDGMIFLAPLVRGFVLSLMADRGAMLGAVRFEMRETIPELNRAFGK